MPDKFAGLIDASLPTSFDAPRSASLSGALLLPEGVSVPSDPLADLDALPGYVSGPLVGRPITGLGRATAIIMLEAAPLLLSGVATLFVAAVFTLVLAGASETNVTARATALRLALGASASDLLREELARYALLAPLLGVSSVLFAVGGTFAIAKSLGVASLVSSQVALVGVSIQCVLVLVLICVRLSITLAFFHSIDLYRTVRRRGAFRTASPLSGGPGLLLVAQGALSAGALLLVIPLLVARGGDVLQDLLRRWPADLVIMHISPAPGITERRVLDVAISARNAIRRSPVAQTVGVTSWLPGVSGGGMVPVLHKHSGYVDSARVQIVVADSSGLALTAAEAPPTQYESENGPLIVNAAARVALNFPACGQPGLLQIGGPDVSVRRVQPSCLSARYVPGSESEQPLIATGAPSDFDGLNSALIIAKLAPGAAIGDLDAVLVNASLADVSSPIFVTDATRQAQRNRFVLAILLLFGGISGVAMLLSTARATGQLVADMQRSSLAVRFAVGAPIAVLIGAVLRRPVQLVALGSTIGVTLVIASGVSHSEGASVGAALGTAVAVVAIFILGALPQLLRMQRYSHTSVLQKDH
ncbi:hypothetical protein [Gemmatimonas sp.]|uniref:hypothetical protein n=1 Tax=Gemmatimonas sp. TaxID=1962908 RepID=UPI00286DF4BF|nr:hypothetical protein [Gemmatimonas sp.]